MTFRIGKWYFGVLSEDDGISWYFYPFNWLRKKGRYWGYEEIYYDGPHRSFGFWFFNVSWRTIWTPWKI